jgi:tagatose-1,6-bisphosphate aldolase
VNRLLIIFDKGSSEFMDTISIGKLRGLQQCATPHGGFAVMALDHRNNLRHAFQPDSPEPASDLAITLFKGEVVEALAPVASAVLLDPELSAAQCIASQKLTGRTGLIVALEATESGAVRLERGAGQAHGRERCEAACLLPSRFTQGE